jgi:UPF0755 protein
MNKTFMQKMTAFFRKAFSENILLSIAIILIVLILLTAGGSYLYMRSYLNTRQTDTRTSELTITTGESVRAICRNLKEKGLIKQELPLLVYLKLTGKAGDLKAGEYRIAHNMTPIEIVDILTKGKVASRKITIPEGWTNEQIANYLEKEGVVSKAEFLKAAGKNYDYWFLKDKPAGASLEGFLFPDTYQVSLHSTAEQIVDKMLANFNSKVDSTRKLEIENSKMNAFETITLASVVEREVSKPEDRKVVAGIFQSRLDIDMALESDATVQYVLNSNKKIFSYEEAHTASPYNTYVNKGLPIGPIGNPGIESINAVLHPTMTDYLYFLSAKGVTYYAKTFDQHEANRTRYLQ